VATLRLLTDAPADAALDTALSAALLAGVADGDPPAFRLVRPAPLVSFGRLDRLRPGFAAAAAAARARGFAPVLRVGGGRAAAAHEGAVSFALAAPAAGDTTERFQAMSALVRAALARVGVAAEVGELPGEYCPGSWSLHAGGLKLAGIDQRVTRGTALTEGLVVVQGGARVRAALVDVYAALDVPWDPRTAGAIEDLVPGVTPEAVAAALRAELAERHELRDGAVDAATLAAARGLRERHRIG
jgi:lipoate-protein ligase A